MRNIAIDRLQPGLDTMHRMPCLFLAVLGLAGPAAQAHPFGGHGFGGGWHGREWHGGPGFERHDHWRDPAAWRTGWAGRGFRPAYRPWGYGWGWGGPAWAGYAWGMPGWGGGWGWGGWGMATGLAAGAAAEEIETPSPPCGWNGPYGCPDVVYQGPYALPAPPASLYPGPGGY